MSSQAAKDRGHSGSVVWDVGFLYARLTGDRGSDFSQLLPFSVAIVRAGGWARCLVRQCNRGAVRISSLQDCVGQPKQLSVGGDYKVHQVDGGAQVVFDFNLVLIFWFLLAAIAIVGVICGTKIAPKTFILRRISYFLWVAVITFSCAMISLGIAYFTWDVWVSYTVVTFLWPSGPIEAFEGFSLTFLFSFALCAISVARSRDAYGDGRRAWMALVPIANLFLLFKSSLTKSENSLRAKTLKVLAVVAAIGLIFISLIFQPYWLQTLLADVVYVVSSF